MDTSLLQEAVLSLPIRAGSWLPSVKSINEYILKKPEEYTPFLIWCLETTTKPVSDGLIESYNLLKHILTDLILNPDANSSKPGSDLNLKPIINVYMTFDRYSKICDEIEEESFSAPVKWPSIKSLRLSAHKNLPWNIKRFIILDILAPHPITEAEYTAQRYVRAVLKNHLILT